MGPVGLQEMVFIFLLALVLFGPKKLPELGRTLGKAISEFRRAQSELKATFDRELQNLERETELPKEIGAGYRYDNYNYDYSSSDAGTYGEPYGSSTTEPQDSTVTNTSTISASATEGAEYFITRYAGGRHRPRHGKLYGNRRHPGWPRSTGGRRIAVLEPGEGSRSAAFGQRYSGARA